MKKCVAVFLLSVVCLAAHAQYKVDRLIRSGEVALHYEDYVLSIQYFNQVVALKPYLYRPWYLRSIAKFYLDDFTGAEADATEAIHLNPYIDGIYDLRAISRIRREDYEGAIKDYNQALRISPSTQNYWFNRALCYVNLKDYAQAQLQTDTIISKWSDYSNAYSLKAEIFLHQKDTLQAAQWLDKSLQINAYDGDAWATRAAISLSRKEWKEADEFLSKAIHLKPKVVNNYVNRALARYNVNNLRGAMADYDMAIDLDPNNFLAHYNRGQLRMQLGDDNRAITDFDFVISLEPDNFLAIFNRALLRDRTGDLKGAIADYTTVINQFPNFWTGLHYRARCYRRMGLTAKAETDEFRILKAQMNKHLGIQPRWSKGKLKEVRKRSEIDPDKYAEMVVADEQESTQEYKSEYRGKIQNRSVGSELMPMFLLSYFPYNNGLRTLQQFDQQVEAFNHLEKPDKPLYVGCHTERLTEQQMAALFQLSDTLSARIDRTTSTTEAQPLLLQRAVAYMALQDYDSAIGDLTTYLQTDSTSTMALWQRAVASDYLARLSTLNAQPTTSSTSTLWSNWQETSSLLNAQADIDRAINLAPDNPYLYYNRGNLLAQRQHYAEAIADYTHAIHLNPNLAEAYYNRGLARIYNNVREEGIKDLSKAGELGLYKAYNVIKQHSK